MDTFRYPESEKLLRRAERVIPTGIPGNLSPAWYPQADFYPNYAMRGSGARFTDADGNEFVDYLCGFGPIILGYSHRKVNEAVHRQIDDATVMSRATPNSIELAEELVDMVEIADWAFFCKNGADVTALAVLTAKAATGRKKIVLINGGYHGTAAWMQPADSAGISDEDVQNVIWIDWNDVAAFERVIAENPGDIAGFMAAPYWMPLSGDDVLPADGYWAAIRSICDREGIALIVDDVRCGFRLDLGGSNEYFGFKPDMMCFSKAMANGYPISALVGSDALREAISGITAIGTFWFEAGAIAAAIATLRELRAIDAARLTIEKGEQFAKVMHEAAAANGYELSITGVPSLPSLRIVGDTDQGLPLSSLLTAECTRRGALLTAFHNGFLTTAHTDADVALTGEIANAAFAALRQDQSRLVAAESTR